MARRFGRNQKRRAREALALANEAANATPRAVITITEEDEESATVHVAFHPSMSDQYGAHHLAAKMLRAVTGADK